jgi:hypothetical protein
MGWELSASKLEQGVQKQRSRVAEDPAWDSYELLARGLRWIDEVDESRRYFLSAAHDVIERIEQRGRGKGSTRARTAGFLRLAGDLDQARKWAVLAIDGLLERGEAACAVETLYAGGDGPAALELAQRHKLRPLAVELAEAERDGNVSRLEAVAKQPAREIVAGRFAPFEAGGAYPLDAWDWLELAHLARARASGEPAPTHIEILQRSGLLGPERSPRVTRVLPGGPIEIAVTGPDGAEIVTTVDRESPDYVEIRLDPRPQSYLALGFDWTAIDGYTAQLFVEPQSSPQQVLPAQGKDFRDVAMGAVDWLESTGEFWERDLAWAARALGDVVARMPLHDSQ